jgi:hypothetical protein
MPAPSKIPTVASIVNALDTATFNALVVHGSAISECGKWLITRVVDKFDHYKFIVTPSDAQTH